MKPFFPSLSIKLFVAFLVFGMGVFSGGQALCEEWSAIQKEVWKMEEKHWQEWKEKSAESLPPFYHKDCIIWGADAAIPIKGFSTYMKYDDLGSLIDSFELKPHEVRVFGNTAIVMYDSNVVFLGKPYRFRCTDIWMKQNGKWEIIGWMHDSCSKLPKCP